MLFYLRVCRISPWILLNLSKMCKLSLYLIQFNLLIKILNPYVFCNIILYISLVIFKKIIHFINRAWINEPILTTIFVVTDSLSYLDQHDLCNNPVSCNVQYRAISIQPPCAQISFAIFASVRVFLKYFSRCYETSSASLVSDYFIFSPSAPETRFYRRVKESRRLRLFSNLRDTIYITGPVIAVGVNLHGIPIAPGANSEVLSLCSLSGQSLKS